MTSRTTKLITLRWKVLTMQRTMITANSVTPPRHSAHKKPHQKRSAPTVHATATSDAITSTKPPMKMAAVRDMPQRKPRP
ncbi:hypothetical protein D9M68_630040 [compost metagenome]